MKFLQNFAASFLALAVFFGFGFFFFIVIIMSMDTKEEFKVKANSILKINLTQPLADRDYYDDFESFDIFGNSANKIGVIDLKIALTEAARDSNITGVLLYAPSVSGGLALTQEARQIISDFKKSGKFVWAYAEVMTEGGYYLSSVADKVYLSPEGSMEWNGLDAEVTFFKNAFKKLDIEPQIFRVGDYKSAVEPFILDKMSDENRDQMTSMLNSFYNSMIENMVEDLDLSAERLRELSDNMEVQTLQDAIDHGLITGVAYDDELDILLAEQVGLSDPDDINWVSYRQYNQSFSNSSKSKNKIAVIIAEGDIMMGSAQRGLITPNQFIKEIRRAREDQNVKAVVFRINSPGGDALASDLIWHEVMKTSKVKPIIASMSNYAASGGYYIAMAADSIVAEPTTLTGSIGIFGMIFNVGDFMANKLGITTDRVTTGEYSNLFTATRSLTPTERSFIQNRINKGYETFTTKAAEGRSMDIDQLKKLASGRVWTGEQAFKNGLIDELGGLQRAIEIAAAKAEVQGDYQVRLYPQQKSSLEELLEKFSSNQETAVMKNKLGDLYPYVDLLGKVKSMVGPQARMLYEIEIR